MAKDSKERLFDDGLEEALDTFDLGKKATKKELEETKKLLKELESGEEIKIEKKQ